MCYHHGLFHQKQISTVVQKVHTPYIFGYIFFLGLLN